MTQPKNSFVIDTKNDNQGFYINEFVKLANKNPNLTVSGYDHPEVRRGLQYAYPGTMITVGTAKNHDVEWVERRTYVCEKGYIPVYDIVKDWNTIQAAVKTYIDGKYDYLTEGGKKVVFHKNFVKIDSHRVDYSCINNTIVLTANDLVAILRGLLSKA